VRALLLTSLLCLTGEARASATAFIELESACAITPEALEQRVTELLLGERDPELGAMITIRKVKGGYEVALRTRHGDAASATKVVAAPSCEEAVQAATVVLALAFGTRAVAEPTAGAVAEPAARAVAEPTARAVAEPAARAVTRPAVIAAPIGPRVVVEPHADRLQQPRRMREPLRLALSTGVDSGTLQASTAYLAAGLSRSFAPLEVYGALRYGAPHVDENVVDAGSERTRLDFGALELGACYGVGHEVRVSACAGSELGVVRLAHSLRLPDGTAVETAATWPHLSGVLTALLAYRGGLIEPRLELAGVVLAAEGRERVPLLGEGAAQAPRAGLRAGLGAAVAF
jgi:hypothetical protein